MKNKRIVYKRKIKNRKIKNKIRQNKTNKKQKDNLQIIGIKHCLDYIQSLNTSINTLAETTELLIKLNLEMKSRIAYLEKYIINNK